MDRAGITLFGVAGLDLAARFAGELLGFGTTIGLAVPVVLAGRLSFGLSTLGAALGWLLLWLVLFLYAPVFFPTPDRSTDDWVVGVPNRLVVATGALGVGLTLEGWIAAWESRTNYGGGIVSGTVSVPPRYAAGLLVGVLVAYLVVVRTRPTAFAARRLPVPDRPTEGTVTGDRYVFLVLMLGVVLAVMSVLFPLPELILVGLQLGDVLYGVGMLVTAGEFYLAARQDLVEGMTGAVLVIWQEVEDLAHLVYVLAPLLWVWYVAVAVVTVLDLPTLVRTSPVGLVGVLGLVTVVGGYVTFHSFRLSERVRARMTGVDEHPRMPLFLLPAGAGVFVVMSVTLTGDPDPNSISMLALSPGLWGLAAASTVVAAVAIARPRLFPSFEASVDDRAVAAVSTTVFLLGTFVAFWATGAVEDSLGSVVQALTVLTVVSLGFWIGPPVFLGDRSLSDRERLKRGLKRSITASAVSLALGAVPVVYGNSPYPPLWELYLSVFTTTMIVSTMCAALFAVVLPFRFTRTG
jgi:hypothetical protein